MVKKSFLLITAAIISAVLCACSININGSKIGLNRVEDRSEKTADSSGLRGISISSAVGSVKLSTWDKDQIYIKVVKINNGISNKSELLDELKNAEVIYNVNNGMYVVKTYLPKFKDNGISVDFDISVPKSFSEFAVDSEVGDVSLSGLNGTIDVVNNVGKIEANGCSGNINLKAATGDIAVKGCSLNGDSNITGSTGRVLFNGSIGKTGTYRFTTNIGEMDITLPPDAAFNLDESTDVGSLQCKFNVSGSSTDKRISGKVNGGGASVILVNNVGSIKLDKK